MTFIVGSFLLPETNHVRIWDEVGGQPAHVAGGGD
jgi:hypothetical protein